MKGDVNKAEKKPIMNRVNSALKEITAAMKQLDRSAEAIKAINSFCHLRSHEPQESLTNIMLQFYKVSMNRESNIIASIKIVVMGMHGLESYNNHVTSFSLFLSRKRQLNPLLNFLGWKKGAKEALGIENCDIGNSEVEWGAMESSDEKSKKPLHPPKKEKEVLPLIKDDVVNDLTRVDLPANFNEPISFQPKCFGDSEFNLDPNVRFNLSFNLPAIERDITNDDDVEFFIDCATNYITDEIPHLYIRPPKLEARIIPGPMGILQKALARKKQTFRQGVV
nr:hypothetical protein [Tanacetum cinerariifolium]